jgi:DNA-binding NarL/FixJ family response regulator
MAAQGMSNKEICNELSLSIHTTESHFGNIFGKLGVYSRIEAVLEALRRGWLTLADTSQPDNSHEK